MKKSTTITVIIVILVVIIGVWIIAASGKQASSSDLSSNSNPTIANNNTTPPPQLFSDSPLSQNAYLISGSTTYDANTKTALSGFKVTKKTLADGSTEITLNSTNPEYQTQIYTVKQGEKLYFIEGISGDDNGTSDRNIGDDTAVLVDANGYIVNQ